MTRRPRLFVGALFALLFTAVNSCDLDHSGPRVRRVPLTLAPHFATVAAQVTGPINLIRLTAREVETNTLVGSSDNAVSPTAAPWSVGVDIDLGTRSSMTILVAVELVSKGSDGVEHVEWSGVAGPITVTAGVPSNVTDLALGRGPLSNASITSVTIADGRNTVGLKDSLALTATAAGATGTPTIFWTSLNDAVATVDATGKVRGVTVGVAPIVATAGTKADTANITVFGGPATIAIAPKPVSVSGIGATSQLSATVKDAIGGVLPTAPVAWTTRDTKIAVVSASGLVTAVALGTTRVVASASATVIDSADVTIVAGPAAGVTISAGNNQSAVVGTAVPVAPAVVVKDNAANPVASAGVIFAVASGGGSITGSATVLTDAAGVATLGGWTLGTTSGTNTLTATVGTFTPVTFTATGTSAAASALVAESGSGQSGTSGIVLTAPLVARVTDNFGNGVPGVTVTFVPSTGGTVGTPTATTNATGRAQTTWTPGTVGMSQQVTAGALALTPAIFTATVTLPNPAIGLSLDAVDKVSQGHSATLRVTLNRVAPAGGTVVTLTSGNPNVLSIAAPATVTIPAGQTTGTITVNGLSEGTSSVGGTATGYDPGTLPVIVELRRITVPTTFTVPFGGSASLPITLVRAAPPGGTLVTLTSSNATAVGLATTTVTVPAGATAINATLNGLLPGQSMVVATNPNYDPDTSVVTSAATLLFTPQSVALNQSFGTTARVGLTSSSTAIAAPAPGITVTLASQAPTCAAVPATVTIPTGLVDVQVPVTYGGSAATPCNSVRIIATAPNITSDTLTASVAATPAITLGAATVAAGLQRAISANLGASNHGGVTVHLVSPDPARILLASNSTTAGSGAIDLAVADGVSSFSYVVQILEGQTTGTSTITATAPGFAGGAGIITHAAPALDLSGMPATKTTFSPDDPFVVRIGTPVAGSTGLSELQSVRIGAAPVAFTVTTSQLSVAPLVSLDSTGGAQIVRIQPGSSSSPGSVATGGVALHAASAGTTVVTASNQSFLTTTNGRISVAVSAPNITLSALTVGAGLQRGMSGFLGASGHNGVVVHLVSADPTRARVSATSDVAGAASADIVVTAGNTSFAYYVSGVEGTTGVVSVTASAGGFNDGSANASVVTPALDLSGVTTSLTTLSPNDAFTVRIGTPSGTTGLTELQAVRAGGATLTATLTSSAPAIAQLVTTASPGAGTVTVQIPAGSFTSPGSVSTGGVELDPLTGGSTIVSAAIPGFTTSTNGTVTVNVNASTISLVAPTVGAGLQRSTSGSLSSSGHGGVTVHLVSANPSVLLLSPDLATVGTASLDIPVAAGNTSFGFYIVGVEGATGTPGLTASAPGFTNGVATIPVVTPALDISGLSDQTTLSPDDPYVVRVGIPQANNAALQELQNVRAGSAGYTITTTTSAPTVARLTTSAGSGSSATARIEAGGFQTAGSVASGGMAFDPLTNGSTTVVASIPGFITANNGSVVVNVTSPSMFVSSATVGAGLMRGISGSLGASNHGGVTVRLTSSQPSTLLLSANDQTAGTPFVDIPVAAGFTNFSYYVHGVENVTGNVTVIGTANGFSDGSGTMSVVKPAIDISGLVTSETTIGPDEPFSVRIGIPSGNGLSELQNVRVGANPVVLTIASSVPSAGQMKTSTAAAGSVTLSIAPRNLQTPSTVASGGVAFDPLAPGTTVVTASSPGFTTTVNATVSVNVTQPVFNVTDATLGAGLQDQVFASIPTNASGAFTVHLQSSDPSRLLLSPDATTAGAASIDIPMSATATSFSYFVQALEGATGTATVTLSAPAFANTVQTVTLLAPSLEIINLSTSLSASAADDQFSVRVGYATPGATFLSRTQAIRVGGATRTITIASSNTAVGVMKTTAVPAGAGSVTISIAAGVSTTPTTVTAGGVAFDPLASGATTVSATISGFTSVGLASGQTISVTP